MSFHSFISIYDSIKEQNKKGDEYDDRKQKIISMGQRNGRHV